MLILIADAFDPSLPGKLAKYGEVTEDASKLAQADVVLIRSKTKATKEYIESAPKLKLIIRGGVGLDNVDCVHAKSKGIQVFNTAEASSIAVAEMAFAMMIAMPNRIAEADKSMKEGKWLKKELKRTELFGKTLGILGVGRIGTEVAKRAECFGMKVVGYDPFVKTNPHAKMLGSIKDVVSVSDYVSLHLPLTKDTQGMINAALLNEFKKGCKIINTGRGKTVVDADVAAALQSGQLGGYATDVWFSEPPENTPLLTAPNVLAAPHIGASTKENLLRIGIMVDQIIGDFVKK